VPNNVKLTRL